MNLNSHLEELSHKLEKAVFVIKTLREEKTALVAKLDQVQAELGETESRLQDREKELAHLSEKLHQQEESAQWVQNRLSQMMSNIDQIVDESFDAVTTGETEGEFVLTSPQ